jgi:hypothetical protein
MQQCLGNAYNRVINDKKFFIGCWHLLRSCLVHHTRLVRVRVLISPTIRSALVAPVAPPRERSLGLAAKAYGRVPDRHDNTSNGSLVWEQYMPDRVRALSMVVPRLHSILFHDVSLHWCPSHTPGGGVFNCALTPHYVIQFTRDLPSPTTSLGTLH